VNWRRGEGSVCTGYVPASPGARSGHRGAVTDSYRGRGASAHGFRPHGARRGGNSWGVPPAHPTAGWQGKIDLANAGGSPQTSRGQRLRALKGPGRMCRRPPAAAGGSAEGSGLRRRNQAPAKRHDCWCEDRPWRALKVWSRRARSRPATARAIQPAAPSTAWWPSTALRSLR
jgi:hypothetical protein